MPVESTIVTHGEASGEAILRKVPLDKWGGVGVVGILRPTC